MTLPDLFAPTLSGRAHRVGLEWQGRELTFGELDVIAGRLAQALMRRGLAAGDRLAVYLANDAAYAHLFLACTRAGIVLVPVNILYREREAGHILRDSAPRAVVSDTGSPADTGLPVWTTADLLGCADTHAPMAPFRPIDPGAPAAILYTSGTTGVAKGAVLTHANFAANARNLVDAWRFTEDDRLLLALPLFHAHGLANGLHCWLLSGCRMRLLPRFDHRTIADDLLDFAPTVFFGVPTMYVRLLDLPGDIASAVGQAARLFVSGSAPLDPAVSERFRTHFGHAILERYGMSETLMTLGNPYEGERRSGTVGLPLPNVTIRIADDKGRDVPDGLSGELWVRSPTVFAGYWQRPDATTAAFEDGWFRTGDVAVRARDGYVTLSGRLSEVIIAGGFNIYPLEVERVLLEDPSVSDAAVAGVPDPVRGEVPVAFVVPAGGSIDAAALESRCRDALASFKVPRAFVQMTALPRTALGKVQKGLLVEEWRRGRPGSAL